LEYRDGCEGHIMGGNLRGVSRIRPIMNNQLGGRSDVARSSVEQLNCKPARGKQTRDRPWAKRNRGQQSRLNADP